MKYHQRDIVEVNFLFPDGTFKLHPAIIVSNDVLQEDEDGLLYLVLISSNDTINPQYSYPLTDEMLIDHSFEKPSLVKCQITAQVPVPMTKKLGRKVGSIKSTEQKREEYKDIISFLKRGYSVRNVAKLTNKGISTVQRIKKEFEL